MGGWFVPEGRWNWKRHSVDAVPTQDVFRAQDMVMSEVALWLGVTREGRQVKEDMCLDLGNTL